MKRLISVLALILLFSFTLVSAAQENPLNLKKCDTEFHSWTGIVCLSENSNGDIAMVLDSCKINVYNSRGEFQYSYSFSFPDGVLSMAGFTENDELWINGKWSTIYFYNEDGAFLREDSLDNFNQTEQEELYYQPGRNKKIKGENGTFKVTSWFGWDKLVLIQPNGTEKIIYETGWDQYWVIILIVLVIIAFFTFIALGIVRTIRSWQNKTGPFAPKEESTVNNTPLTF